MIDPPPAPPMNHMEYWWTKYRYTTGLVTEAIAADRTNVAKQVLSVTSAYKIKRGAAVMAAPVVSTAWVYTLIKMCDDMNEIESRHHWD